MLNVYMLRHGQTQYNAEGNRYCGRTDIPLTEKGRHQAELVRQQIGDIDFEAIYSSPLERAYATALIAAGGRPVITDDRLLETDFGVWEGKTQDEFVAENETLWLDWLKDPGTAKAGGNGETAQDVIDRVADFFEAIQQKHPSGNILVVAHNGVNRFYLAHKLGINIKNYRRLVQENSVITMFRLHEDGELTLVLLNSRL